MTLQLLYFAAVRELIGKDEESVTVPSDVATIGALRRWVEREREPLRGRLGAVRLARNEEFARDDDPIADGDVIALIPPVAGG